MKLKYFVWAYVVMGVLVTLFGGAEGRGFAYNLGRGLIWPAVVFPGLGKFLGGLLIVAFCGWVALNSGRK